VSKLKVFGTVRNIVVERKVVDRKKPLVISTSARRRKRFGASLDEVGGAIEKILI
jgi:hypothetical protein